MLSWLTHWGDLVKGPPPGRHPEESNTQKPSAVKIQTLMLSHPYLCWSEARRRVPHRQHVSDRKQKVNLGVDVDQLLQVWWLWVVTPACQDTLGPHIPLEGKSPAEHQSALFPWRSGNVGRSQVLVWLVFTCGWRRQLSAKLPKKTRHHCAATTAVSGKAAEVWSANARGHLSNL